MIAWLTLQAKVSQAAVRVPSRRPDTWASRASSHLAYV